MTEGPLSIVSVFQTCAVDCLVQGEWSEAQKHFKHLLGRGSRVRAPIVTINTIMAAYMKQGMFEQVGHVLHNAIRPNTKACITCPFLSLAQVCAMFLS